MPDKDNGRPIASAARWKQERGDDTRGESEIQATLDDLRFRRAVERVHGTQAGLDALDSIRQRSVLEGNHLYHTMRGTFAAELGQTAAALTHYRQAAKLALLPIERDFIARRIEECEAATKL